MKKINRILTAFLTLCLLLTLLPGAALAADEGWLWPVEGHTAWNPGHQNKDGRTLYWLEIWDSGIAGAEVRSTGSGTIVDCYTACTHTGRNSTDGNGCDCAEGRGNFVKIRLDSYPYYVIYSNMQYGSLSAKCNMSLSASERHVVQGELLGRVGNSGNAIIAKLLLQVNSTYDDTSVQVSNAITPWKYSISEPAAESTLAFGGMSVPTGSINLGTSFTVTGKVTSNYNITGITGRIFSTADSTAPVQSFSAAPDAKSFNVNGSAADDLLRADELAAGTYYVAFAATDSSGKTVTWSSADTPFTVNDPAPVPPVTYTVAFDANGGSNAPAAQTKTEWVVLNLSLEIPVLDGYDFLGWARSRTATAAEFLPGGRYTANKTTTLYAVWRAVPVQYYTVTYDANGGSGAPPAQTKTGLVPLTISSVTPTRANYNFRGWATTKTAATAQYMAGGSYTADAAVKLYAVWTLIPPATYTVSYDANGGSGAPEAQTKTEWLTLTLSDVLPVLSGYDFLGWATSKTATTAQYVAGGSYTENASATLYAVWSKTKPVLPSARFLELCKYDNRFTDVPQSMWYYSTIARAFELGLFAGMGADSFAPGGSLTYAQSVTVAARLHSIYTRGTNVIDPVPGQWYNTYINYAKNNGILYCDKAQKNPNGEISRSDFAVILSSALPAEALWQINDVPDGAIPDVKNCDSTVLSGVYLLYRAGVLAGNDSYGTFYPDKNISRAEAATIVARMADETLRKHLSLA